MPAGTSERTSENYDAEILYRHIRLNITKWFHEDHLVMAYHTSCAHVDFLFKQILTVASRQEPPYLDV